jgi:hypothetical protein
MAKNAIDVVEMHSGIHYLYLVNRKPKTTCDLFWQLSRFNDENPPDEFKTEYIWSKIHENAECLGEIHPRYIKGDKFWRNGKLDPGVIFDDGDDKYNIIGSYDVL